LKIKGTNISMTRGDSESITVRCSEPFAAGDTVTMTVREDVESEIVLQKNATSFDENGAAVLAIEPGDTEGLEFGDYVYDIQIRWADGTVATVLPVSRFHLEGEVTY